MSQECLGWPEQRSVHCGHSARPGVPGHTVLPLLLLSFSFFSVSSRAAAFGGRQNERDTEAGTETSGGGGLSHCWGVWPSLACTCRGSLWGAAAIWEELCPASRTLWASKPHVQGASTLSLVWQQRQILWGHSGGCEPRCVLAWPCGRMGTLAEGEGHLQEGLF